MNPPVLLLVDLDTGLTVTFRPGPRPESVPSGARGDEYEVRTASPVRRPDRLVLTAAEFAALTRWLASDAKPPRGG